MLGQGAGVFLNSGSTVVSVNFRPTDFLRLSTHVHSLIWRRLRTNFSRRPKFSKRSGKKRLNRKFIAINSCNSRLISTKIPTFV